ncbi:MAG TPA: hypothetical protein DCM05_09975, partial [Elusimicrobia bacterium]|nr:hypothetical protein [Elusimicrobiota bacterium]
ALINYADAGGSGLNLASLAVRLDGALVAAAAGASQATADLTGLAQGVHTLSASIADNAGNAATTTNTFTVDLTSPTIMIARPAEGSFMNYTSTAALINYADTGGSGLNLSSLRVRLDGALVAATAGASLATVNLAGLVQGVHTLDASIADNAGNRTSASQVSFTVSLSSPVISIARPAQGSFMNYTSTAAIINYADAGGSGLNLSSLRVRLDGNLVAASAGPNQAAVDLASLAEGAHTLSASIADNVGNEATTQNTFTVNLTSPSISIALPPDGSFMKYTSTAAVIDYADAGGAGLNLASLAVRLDGNLVAAAAGASQATVSLAGLAQGAHILSASIADNEGNRTTTQNSFTVDLTSPAIAIALPPNGSFMNAASTTAIINYADTGGSGLNLASLVVRLDGSLVAASAGPNQAAVDLASLAEGVHTLDASIADNAGNQTSASQVSFTVSLSSPVISIARPFDGSFMNNTSTAAVIDYADAGGAGLNLASLVVRLDGNLAAAAAGASQAAADLAGLAQGVHTLDASIADNAGNRTSASQVRFTVDLTSPAISIVQPPNGSFMRATSTMAIVNYADAGGSGLNLASLIVRLDGNPLAASAGASQATVALASLAEGVHTLDASIADNAGNRTSASQVSFTVSLSSPSISIARPSEGSFMNNTSTAATIDYADAGGTGLDLASLEVRLDGNLVAAAAGASQAAANLAGLAQGAHTLDASIADNAGNRTSASQVRFIVDLASPTIAIVLPPNNSLFHYTSTTAIITYADAGGSGLNLTSLLVRLDGNPLAAVAGASQAVVNLASLAAGVHTLDASIADNAGNRTSASQVRFTVDLSTPPALCTISGINPNSGIALGGTVITITGTGFSGNSGPGGVTFDGVDAAVYSVNSSSTVITATTPRYSQAGSLSTGPVPLLVTTSVGTCQVNYIYLLAAAACGDDYFYPSPATGATGNFAYCMGQPGTVRVRVYNVIGDLVARLEDARPAGAQRSSLNTARLAPGVYLYLLEKDYGGGYSERSRVKKFVVRH